MDGWMDGYDDDDDDDDDDVLACPSLGFRGLPLKLKHFDCSRA